MSAGGGDAAWPGVAGPERRARVASVLRQALRNDPFDLGYEYSSEQLGTRAALGTRRLTVWDTFRNIATVPWAALNAIGRPMPTPEIAGRLFFLVGSSNHLHAAAPVIDRLGSAAAVGDRDFGQAVRRRASLYALPFLPVLLYRWLRASRYRRSTLRGFFSEYWLSYGLFLVAWRILGERTQMVVATSDHALVQRTMVRAARFLGIPTAFIPHAGVTRGLPPLGFDVAFLDGEYGREKYASAGSSPTTVFLAGVPRLDPVIRAARESNGQIGLCPALGDSVDTVIGFLSRVAEKLAAASITLRPHPRVPDRDRYVEAAKALGCVYSDARSEAAGDFLRAVDVVVCGDSNLIIEALIARRWVVFFDALPRPSDQYGYVQDGLPHAVCRDADDLLNFLASHDTAGPPPAEGLDRFMATLGTPWEGRSAELIAATLPALTESPARLAALGWERSSMGVAAGPVFTPTRSAVASTIGEDAG